TLLVAKEIAEADGFELIHAVVDSLYVWKDGATREDYERLSQKIEDRTRLPLAIEAVYRYVVFLPSKQYADVPVPTRFFAVGVDIRELVVSKRITREPRDYQKAGVTAIAAQQLFGSGVKLRPGQNIEYIITNSEAHVPNDRVRAYALWEGWFGYDRKKYAAML